MHPCSCGARRVPHESCGCARFCNGRAGWRLNTAVSTGYTVYLHSYSRYTVSTDYTISTQLQSTDYSLQCRAGLVHPTGGGEGRSPYTVSTPPQLTALHNRPSAIELN